MHLYSIGFGVVIGGAIMFYIQPTIKLWVAQAFGTERSLMELYNKLAIDARTAIAKKGPPPTSPPAAR